MRCRSPRGGSTLITSAPKSDRITAAPGPAIKLARSSTFNPEKMLSVVIGSPHLSAVAYDLPARGGPWGACGNSGREGRAERSRWIGHEVRRQSMARWRKPLVGRGEVNLALEGRQSIARRRKPLVRRSKTNPALEGRQ